MDRYQPHQLMVLDANSLVAIFYTIIIWFFKILKNGHYMGF